MPIQAGHHIHGVSLACRGWPNIEFWCGSFVNFQGIRTNIAKKSYFCDFSGGGWGPDPLFPAGSTHDRDLSQLNLSSGSSTKKGSNQSAQLQRLARMLRCCMKKVLILYFQYIDNKGAFQTVWIGSSPIMSL